MAGRFVTLVLDAALDMHPSAKLVLVALADHANHEHGGLAFPSIAELARRTEICERQVRHLLRLLEARSWVAREGSGRGGRAMATRYRLNLPLLTLSAEKRNAEKKAAVQFPVYSPKPGSGLPGNSHAIPAVSDENPATQVPKHGSAASITRQPTAPEQKLTGSSITRNEPEGARSSARAVSTESPNAFRENFPGNLESKKSTHMTREQQIEAARRLAQQLRENK